MSKMRIGQVDYLTTLPVCHALEDSILPFAGELIKGSPTMLNKMFLAEQLDVACISSIEYARNVEKCMIIPNLSASADGPVHNIYLFSKVPVTELEGKKICLASEASTSVAVLKVLFDHYYHVDARFTTTESDIDKMMSKSDGALLIGDYAMRAHLKVKNEDLPYHITDLGEVWKQFTGEKMVYGLWVVKRDFAKEHPEEVQGFFDMLVQAKQYSSENMTALLKKGRRRTGLPMEELEEFFNAMNCELEEDHRKALLTFYDYCYKSGLIDERVRLAVWGEEDI